MSNFNIYHTEKLTETEAQQASQLKADIVLCNEIKANGPFDFEVVDANQYRIEGGWLAYEKNAELLDEMKDSWPGIFEYDGISLENAIRKALFWCNRKSGYLVKASETLYSKDTKLNTVELHPGKRTRTTLMFAKYYGKALKGGRYFVPEYKIDKHVTIGFLIEDMFEFNFLKNLIDNFPKKEVLLVLPPFHRFSKSERDELKQQEFTVLECKTGGWLHLPFTLPLKFNKKESWAVQMILNNLPAMSQCLMWGEALFQSSLQVLVTVAQENTPFGHILSELAASHHKVVVNTMNGIKYGEGNDADTSFQHWMVWDDEMKKLLVDKAGANPNRLVVAGSLSQDDVKNRTYNQSLPVDEETLKNKKVISVMSTRDLRPDKVEALKTLYTWADNNEDVIILYRPHPAETEENYFLPKEEKINLHIIKPEAHLAKTSLLDQLIASDLVINFGSTVSIESKWVNTPCITYEKKPFSWLYCVDGKMVFHFNTPDQLLNSLKTLQKKKAVNLISTDKNVSDVYADHIKKWKKATKN